MIKHDKKLKALYQIKVTLVRSKPPIWRRLIVKDNIRLDRLHSVLQVVMGWSDCHLHQYIVGNVFIGKRRRRQRNYFFEMKDERRFYLHDILSNTKDSFIYEYDFGDSWKHKIVLEKILPLDFSESPVVIKGRKACPPEDCGGIWGYYDFLDVIQDPEHEDYEHLLEWIGEEFDPDELDMNLINKELNDLEL